MASSPTAERILALRAERPGSPRAARSSSARAVCVSVTCSPARCLAWTALVRVLNAASSRTLGLVRALVLLEREVILLLPLRSSAGGPLLQLLLVPVHQELELLELLPHSVHDRLQRHRLIVHVEPSRRPSA